MWKVNHKRHSTDVSEASSLNLYFLYTVNAVAGAMEIKFKWRHQLRIEMKRHSMNHEFYVAIYLNRNVTNYLGEAGFGYAGIPISNGSRAVSHASQSDLVVLSFPSVAT